MKLVGFAVFVISSLAWSQTPKDPGHPSQHASVGRKYGKASTAVNTPNTNALAVELAKIEQQGAHAPASSAAPHAAATSIPKAPPSTQNKNRPMKFSYRPPQGSHNTQPH